MNFEHNEEFLMVLQDSLILKMKDEFVLVCNNDKKNLYTVPFPCFGVGFIFKMRWKYSLALDSLKVMLNPPCCVELHRGTPGALVGKVR